MALIALGVTGGIGAYKAVEIARGLQKNGHDVVAIMTRSAEKFVGPLTFEAITRREVITDQWKPGANADIEHIAIASNIDLLLVAPATANTIGKFANGLADDFLSSLYTATRAPVLIAPAMNSNMFDHPAVAKNLETLIARGVHVVDPGSGYLACGWIGKGRLAEPEDVVAAAEQLLKSKTASTLAGRSILITAGPTFEDIDPVRFVGNRSSGRMGYAIAAEALRRGAAVTLVTGPTHLAAPHGADRGEGAQRLRDARRGDGAHGWPGRDRHVGRRRGLLAGGAGEEEDEEGRRARDDHAESDEGHPRRARQAAVAQAGIAGARRLCRRDQRRRRLREGQTQGEGAPT